MQVHAEAGLELSHPHAGRLAVEDPASGQTAGERFDSTLCVDVMGLEEHQRLGDQLDRARDDELVCRLCCLTRTRRATWTMVVPRALKTGWAASKALTEPHAMIDRAPSTAPCLPPEIGASLPSPGGPYSCRCRVLLHGRARRPVVAEHDGLDVGRVR
jgi:hypothetical protein